MTKNICVIEICLGKIGIYLNRLFKKFIRFNQQIEITG